MSNTNIKSYFIIIGLVILGLFVLVFISNNNKNTEVVKKQDEKFNPIVSQDQLIENDWKLFSMNGEAIPSDIKVTAKFEESGRLSGFSGCNTYNGGYEVDGNSIKINENMAMTLMGCTEPISQIENEYISTLPKSKYYSITDGNLYLLDSERNPILEYEAIKPLSFENTSWSAISVNNGNEAVVSLIIGTEITANFNEDGTVSGNSGCNEYNGSYEYNPDDKSIEFGPMASTRKFCAEPEGVMDQEQNYLSALSNSKVYNFDINKLEFRDESGALQVNYNEK